MAKDQRLSLYVPEPAVRPGGKPDFSNVPIPEAGSVQSRTQGHKDTSAVGLVWKGRVTVSRRTVTSEERRRGSADIPLLVTSDDCARIVRFEQRFLLP